MSLNYFSDWFRDLFEVKKPQNLLIIIALFIAFALIIFFALWDKISLMLSNQYNLGFFKNKLLLTFIFLSAVMFWIIRVFFITSNKQSYVDSSITYSQPYAFLAFILAPLAITSFYYVISFVTKLKSKSVLVNTITFSALNALSWIFFMVLTFQNQFSFNVCTCNHFIINVSFILT
ncbi:MSC_0624 family F1-like ATPase-associated membrane protein [Mycoplasma simbae]|uniref:MSC_0624 family F1-like ATPase-associated membrane protein n=1 Tax=Mycoplasma simbae TaxID=36744 RepID=UPI000496317A|nr:hypothetical protein [Mycoplasma simbae]